MAGSLGNLQVHHKIRRRRQGDGSLDNLVTLCAYCHMAEHGQLSYQGKGREEKRSYPKGRPAKRHRSKARPAV
jgi:5-methylcytosine-specific restriction endonuclease McrA